MKYKEVAIHMKKRNPRYLFGIYKGKIDQLQREFPELDSTNVNMILLRKVDKVSKVVGKDILNINFDLMYHFVPIHS